MTVEKRPREGLQVSPGTGSDSLKNGSVFLKRRTLSPNGPLGRRQVVRHKVLVLAFAGSNPAAPARFSQCPGALPLSPYPKTLLTDLSYCWSAVVRRQVEPVRRDVSHVQ